MRYFNTIKMIYDMLTLTVQMTVKIESRGRECPKNPHFMKKHLCQKQVFPSMLVHLIKNMQNKDNVPSFIK